MVLVFWWYFFLTFPHMLPFYFYFLFRRNIPPDDPAQDHIHGVGVDFLVDGLHNPEQGLS